jgi:hypothetical protein
MPPYGRLRLNRQAPCVPLEGPGLRVATEPRLTARPSAPAGGRGSSLAVAPLLSSTGGTGRSPAEGLPGRGGGEAAASGRPLHRYPGPPPLLKGLGVHSGSVATRTPAGRRAPPPPRCPRRTRPASAGAAPRGSGGGSPRRGSRAGPPRRGPRRPSWARYSPAARHGDCLTTDEGDRPQKGGSLKQTRADTNCVSVRRHRESSATCAPHASPIRRPSVDGDYADRKRRT